MTNKYIVKSTIKLDGKLIKPSDTPLEIEGEAGHLHDDSTNALIDYFKGSRG